MADSAAVAVAAIGQTTNNWKTVGGREQERERERRHITRQLCSFEASAQDSQTVIQAWDEGAFTPALVCFL